MDNAESIDVCLVEHIDEVTSSGGKRKRITGRTYAILGLNLGREGGRERVRGIGRAINSAIPPPIMFESFKSIIQTVKRKYFSLGLLKRVRGVVHCLDCQQARCLYSMQVIAKMKPPGEHTKEEGIDCKYMIHAFISCLYLGVLAPFASSSHIKL